MVEKSAESVRRMFASIAHRYDFLNRLLSLSIDRRWRRLTKERLARRLPPSPYLLDLCAGTGDLALAISGLGKVAACDFCRPMLTRGLQKARDAGSPVFFVEGDALRLPFADAAFDAVSIAFGLRNIEDLQAGLAETLRVLKPSGTLAVLEFSLPTFPVFRQLYRFYFTRVLPRMGAWLSGAEGPYSYLPRSVQEFPEPPRLAREMTRIGYAEVCRTSLTGGVATLYLAGKRRG
ncbi:MAG TPA: ubiquinone/menaquinone biosynthesis methyltransferase [Acidobacteriota bacterium]|nr:ubiquinone/menaquinone biosynthesis methyltransferase [Acidobacteriota bacterium]